MLLMFVLILALLVACGPTATTIPPNATRPASTPVGPGAPSGAPTTIPTTASAVPVASASDAIALAQKQFPELSNIKATAPGTIGASTNITVQDQPDGWNLIFWQGSGDCPSGCINHHYWYISVDKGGRVLKAVEYVREFDSGTNAFKATGTPLWGVPKQ